ncbi:MAG: zinc-binding dehydrogenase [Chloroflexi bacterium]|nr:zinc-binding dehydrogenase [Chloroflexota bacterium]
MMKAAQYIAPGQIDIVEVPLPVAAPGQVMLRVDKVTVCGSDLHALHDSPVESYPFLPGCSGHECVATVETADGQKVRIGDRVLVIPPGSDALVEYMALDPRYLIPIPDSLSMEQGILGQQLGTVIWCCRKLSNVLDKTVVVVGQGPAGLLFTALLYRMGAKQVIGLDVVDHRLETARRMGASHTVNVYQADPVAAVAELTRGKMADVVCEVVGKEETINLCPDLAHDHAELALFGVPKRMVFPFAYEKFLRRQLRTVTSAHTQAEADYRSFRLGLDMIAQGRIDVSPLITHRLPFTDVHRAFELAETKQDGAVKVMLDFKMTPGEFKDFGLQL